MLRDAGMFDQGGPLPSRVDWVNSWHDLGFEGLGGSFCYLHSVTLLGTK